MRPGQDGIAVALVLVAGACGQVAPPPEEPRAQAEADEPVRIVATERSSEEGGILVAIRENGDRAFHLVAPAASGAKVRDSSPAFSPDGKWIVFASSRGRSLENNESSLWIVAVGYEQPPVRLTDAKGIDRDPVWTPAGDAIVFSSSRAGSLDLWRLRVAVKNGQMRAAGQLEQLTTGDGHELAPTIAPDGRIAYASLVVKSEKSHESRIEERAVDGSIKALTKGPGDLSPRFDPKGERLAFTRPVLRKTATQAAIDADVFVREHGKERAVVDLPLTDEGSPVWSSDGRWLFATSIVRSARDNRPILASVIHVDLDEARPVARILEDSAGTLARLTPALAPGPLDAAALHRDAEYAPRVADILTKAIERKP